jgi:hypothetical protein
MKINIAQHKEDHELHGDRKEQGNVGEGLQRTQGSTWGLNIGSLFCGDGEQVSMMAASSNMLPINMQFITSCAETQ